MLDHPPMTRPPGSRLERDKLVRAVCQECSVGCGLLVGVEDGRVVDVQGDDAHPVSGGTLCARGTAFVQGLSLPERLTQPAIRGPKGALQPSEDWKVAMDALADRLRKVKEKSGPDSLVIGCDLEGGLDFHLGALRFAQLWGTSQVFHALGPAPEGRPAASCSDWANSGCLFLVEADLAATHPVAFRWVQEAQRRGARVVAADACFTGTLAKADHTLRLEPGTGNLLGLALTKLILAEGGAAKGDAAWKASFEKMSLEGAEAILGVSAEQLQGLARLLMKGGPVTVITGRALAGLEHHAIWPTLAAAMGWAEFKGGGWYPLDAGVPPFRVQDGAAKPAPALAEVKERGDVKAIICSGNSLDHLSPFGELAKNAELLVHFGAYPNATWERASMTFPAALWAERDGLAFSNDGAVQWGPKVVDPPAGCRSGLDFWAGLARRFGWEKQFPWATEEAGADLAAFYSWLLAQSPSTAGLKLDALKGADPRTQIIWPAGKSAPSLYKAPPALASGSNGAGKGEDFPFALLSARAGCRPGDAMSFWPWTQGLVQEDAVQIHPETAGLLGIQNGDEVQIATPQGDLAGRACISRAVPPWRIASPRGVNGVPAIVHRKDQPLDEARSLLRRPNS
jgi:sulfite reductase (NADPH) flavoprotein alpha-component